VLVDVAWSVLFAILCVAMISYGVPRINRLELWLGAAALLYGAIVAAALAAARLRYRYVFRAKYTLGPSGISIQDRLGTESVPWGDIAQAEYLPIILMYRLTIPQRDTPAVLFVRRGSSAAENMRLRAARSLLSKELEGRLKTRWVPW
jgi:hypothetical protein